MGSKKLSNIPISQGGTKQEYIGQSVPPPPEPVKRTNHNPEKPIINYLDDLERPVCLYIEEGPMNVSQKNLAIEICSILPPAYAEANYLLKKYPDILEFQEIRDIFGNTIGLGKWNINMLVNYKRNYTKEAVSQKDFYIKGKDYTKNFDTDLKRATESDLSFLSEHPYDYGESATENKEFILWQYLNKANQIFKTIPEDQDTGNLRLFLDHCLSSAYRICTKLKKYTDEFSSDLLDKSQFDRRIPW